MEIKNASVVDLAIDLMSRASVTPHDDGCQEMIARQLKKSGFHCESMRFGDVDNLYARIGKTEPLFVFAGHTDVVSTGPLNEWISPPFEPEVRDGMLYGRGASDMKAAIAAMITAAENFIAKHEDFDGSIAFLLTSDEEGPSINGTAKVIEALNERQEKITYCIVGEPSSNKETGDQIRIGRRGSMGARLVIHGKQGHVAMPQLAKNPIHMCMAALDELSRTVWDQGNNEFPPTTMQVSNIHAGTGAENVIPGHIEVLFNFRFSTAVTPEQLQQRVEEILNKHKLDFDIQWRISAKPFLSPQGKLIKATEKAILDLTGIKTKPSTGGGTSDARFIAVTGAEVIELGLLNATAHHINEHVSIIDLETLAQCYEKILENLLG
jgi:succinyl-diaminopimelate desuccinylase